MSEETKTQLAWFVCKYQNHWGRGRTADEARKAARKVGGRGELWAVFKLPAGAHNPFVDGIGQIMWDWSSDMEDDKKTNRVEVVKHGRKFKKS